MDFINKILEFVLNEEKKISSKAAIIIVVIVGVIIIDNVFSFSYSYSTDRKIEQIKKLNDIITDPASDKDTKNFAISLRKEISKRQNILKIFKIYISEFHFSNNTKNLHKKVQKKTLLNTNQAYFGFIFHLLFSFI